MEPARDPSLFLGQMSPGRPLVPVWEEGRRAIERPEALVVGRAARAACRFSVMVYDDINKESTVDDCQIALQKSGQRAVQDHAK